MLIRPLFDLKGDIDVVPPGRTLSCVSCGLYKGVSSPRMAPYGENRRDVMIIGEGPGEVEDARGKPWQGRTGRLLQRALHDIGFDLAVDCVSLNAVNCRPTDEKGWNREPTGFEIACCRTRIVNPAIARYGPKIILLLGGSALSSVLGPLCSYALGASVGKWRGFTIPIPELGAWVCPTYHPSFVAREADKEHIEVDTVWRQDIARALGMLDVPVPEPEDLRRNITVLRTEDEILQALSLAHDAELLSYDYETTGTRAVLHEVICVSFCCSADRAYAFMMPQSGSIPAAWAQLMSDNRVGKIAHYMKFENAWTIRHFGVAEINWAWDSLLGAHVVDNRVGICGLDRQAFLYFGIRSWDDLIAPYMAPVDRTDIASPNRIREFIVRYGEDECLIYCGIDSLIAFRLAVRQMGEILIG